MTTAIYPGSFDPITMGHLDIIERSSQIFDQVIVAVCINPDKNPLFSMQERVELIRQACRHLPKVQVDCFAGLLIDFVNSQQANVIVRGLRAVSDFESEFQMSLMNKRLNQSVETVFLTSQTDYAFLSSSLVKEVASFGGNVEHFLPPVVAKALKDKYNRRKNGGE